MSEIRKQKLVFTHKLRFLKLNLPVGLATLEVYERLMITTVCQGVAMVVMAKALNHYVLMEAICNWGAGLQTL